jgi:hypothetical protein
VETVQFCGIKHAKQNIDEQRKSPETRGEVPKCVMVIQYLCSTCVLNKYFVIVLSAGLIAALSDGYFMS